MSTPTTNPPHHANSASKKAAGHVSTPSHLGLSSPAPRSVPSPAATRKEQAGKTPMNHPTTSSSQGSKTVGGTPMVQSLSQTGNNAASTSPNPHGIAFGTPVGLGVDITPSQLNMPTPGMGGVPMTLTMSDLGLTASGGQKRNEDEERKARMRGVLRSVGRPKGRVSEEGIGRITRRVGFTFGGSGPAANRTLNVDGPKKIAIEIQLQDDVPQSVQVGIDANDAVQTQTDRMGSLLLDDLRSHEQPIEAKLNRFAANLERLAHLDRLSTESINCFEALTGIYTSLTKLFEQERKLTGRLDQVLCKKSGRPTMHADGKIGLKLRYWSTSRPVKEEAETADGCFDIHVTIEHSPAALYPPLRISDAWLSDPLELSADGGIPWQDPPPTFDGTNNEGETIPVEGGQKLPDLRFTAKLDPPILVPWLVGSELLQSVGLPAPQAFVMPPAWHTAMISSAPQVPYNDPASIVPITSEAAVLSKSSDGEEVEVIHQHTLELAKGGDAAYVLEHLPFSHPRQLIDALPTLRQWACLSSLLKKTFEAEGKTGEEDGTGRVHGNDPETSTASQHAPELLTPPATPADTAFADRVPIHVSLTTSPVPSLELTFPEHSMVDQIGVCVQVLPNAELCVSTKVGAGKKEAGTDEAWDAENKKKAKALEVCGDLGVWIEWLRRRAA
jgi:hypothetical protein